MSVLVTAASMSGSMQETCDAIGRILVANGVDANVRRLEDVSALEGYAGAVIGSVEEAGRWLPPARRFLEHNAYQLRLRPVWLFSGSPRVDASTSSEVINDAMEEPADVAELASLVRARDHVVFAGRLARQLPGVGDRTVIRVVHGPGGDYREWSSIDDWARRIAREVLKAA